MNSKFLALVLVFSSILLTSTFVSARAASFTQQDNEAKEEIFSALADKVNSSYSQYRNITAGLHNGSILTIYNQSEPTTIPPVVNETEPPVVNETEPPITCPAGQHFNQTTSQCEDDVIIPPIPEPPVDKPNPNFNQTTWLRIAAVADIDNNNGLTTQLNLAKKYHVQVLLVPGDYGYSSCKGVIDKIKAAGFTNVNAVIIQGNHDCGSDTKAFNGYSQLYGSSTFASGKLEVFALNGNTGLSCSDTQFAAMKDKIQSSDAWYNIAVIHQPFVINADGHHGENKQFACWDPVFRANGVNLVLQGHEHNYQRYDINGLPYAIVGTGTHDTGGNMYPLGTREWKDFECQKCFTGTNGIAIIDLQIDNPHVKNMQGWFISNSEAVKDSFN